MHITDKIKNEIINYWKNHKFCNNVNLYIPKNSQTDLYLESQLKLYPWFETKKRLISFIVKDIYEPVKCKACGKLLKMSEAAEGKIFCSVKCSQNDKEVLEKRKQTNIKNLGVAFPSQNQSSKEKFKQTMIQKYGSEYSLQSDIIKNKYKQTMQEKYHCNHPFHSEEIKNKFKETMINRYGCDHPSKIEEIRERHSKRERELGYDIILNKWKDYVIPLFTKEEYKGMQRIVVTYRWKCVKCGYEFEQKNIASGFHSKEIGSPYLPVCPKCYPISHTESFAEKELVNFIKLIYNEEIIENDKTIIKPYELDIYLPEKNIAIEFDGLFWHSENKGKDKNYHINKTELCNNKNIHLIHIFEDEWLYKQNIVKDRIKSILGIDRKRIYARKCIIKEIDIQTSNEFLENNHLQGKDNAKIRYGLFYENELVSVMTFGKPRFNKNYQYELIRFSSKIGYQVIGDASKLLTYFINQYYPESIISYADIRYSNGKLYEAIGFTILGKSPPNYFYIKNKEKFNRYQCQKYKLKKILKDKFNPDLSESENMKLNGYDKIYDCGNLIYLYKPMYNKNKK